MPADNAIDKQGRVLATLNEDGSRRWLRPRLSTGGFWKARRVVAYLLILLFALVPHLTINGTPVLRIDLPGRTFYVLGGTFLPSDTLLMALLMVTLFVSIFLITALFGRVWCGWACPQTVYMEFLYRPIERLFDGAPGKKQRIKGSTGLRRFLKYATFFACSVFLAHTFLAYFVPPRELITWVTRSPLDHPVSFIIMTATTLLMMLDFGFFREQVCLVMCPYGRFQAALLDKHSMIVTYDESRGEPRGKQKRRPKKTDGDVHLKVVDEPAGDCIDCHMCVTTCPTGIDIRDGLQMECIGCAQCIDACDSVMDKVGKPRGLVRYSSQALVSGETKRVVRPRTVIYPLVLGVILTVFATLLVTKQTGEAQILRAEGLPFYPVEGTTLIENQVRMRLVNRGDEDATYTFSVDEGASLVPDDLAVTLEPGASEIVGFRISVDENVFGPEGMVPRYITVTGDDGFEERLRCKVLGPMRAGTR